MESTTEKMVLILSYNRYPDGDAGAVRDMIFAQMYNQMGYKVLCVGKGSGNGTLGDVQYMSAFDSADGIIHKIKQTKRYISTVKEIVHQYGNQIDVIHILDIPLSLIQYIKKQKKKYNWQLVHDSVEWYSACEFKYGKLSRAYIHKDMLNRFVIDKKFKVIAISRYLFRYYSAKSINTIRIPVLMNITTYNDERNATKREGKNILYAGSPAKKDCLGAMIEGVRMLAREEKKQLKFHIIGVNEKQLEQYISKKDYEDLKDIIIAYGRKSREFVLDMHKKVDFTVLLRLNERYANAGFSTKVVESLAQGVPIICNMTSDMELFCKDGENVICVENASGEKFAEALRRYLNLSEAEIRNMSEFACKTAEDYFDKQLYKEEFKNFILG